MASDQIINNIYKQIDILARRIENLQNNAVPTVPIYDPTNFPQDALEGQVALGTDDNAWKFWNGAWKKIGGIPDHIVFYDKSPQLDNWLYVEADQPASIGNVSPNSYTIELVDSYNIAAGPEFGGIRIASDQQFVLLDSGSGSAQVTVSSTGSIGLRTDGTTHSGSSTIQLAVANSPHGVILFAGDSSSMSFDAGTTFYTFPGIHTRLQAGAAFSVGSGVTTDASEGSFTGTGSMIFRIFETGAIQMRFLPTSDPGVTGQLWNNSGSLMVSL